MNYMELDVNELFYRIEDKNLEYKEGFDNDDVTQTIASFSTSEGGYILIGVKNDGTPIGYRCSKEKVKAKLNNLAKDLNGGKGNIQIDFKEHAPEKYIVIVKVYEGDRKPYGWKGAYYKRVDSRDEKLSPEEIMEIKLKSKNLTFDSLINNIHNRKSNISDLDNSKILNYIQLANSGKRNRQIKFDNIKNVLKNLDLLIGDCYIKNTAMLFFGKKPQDSFQNAKINFLIYIGDSIDSSKLKYRKHIEGDLINQIQEPFNFIKSNTENKVIMDGLRRIEINQYPMEAIREALINAVAHRDYSVFNSDIVIRLFSNRLEIINPGGLMEGVTLQELKKGGHPSVRRNPKICYLLDNLGLMEQAGQGIKNIIGAMKRFGLEEPKIESDNGFFKIEFKGQKLEGNDFSKHLIGSSMDLEPVLTDLERRGLKYINSLDKFQSIRINEYMKRIKSKTRITAKRHLDKFVELGILEVSKLGKSLIYKKV